MQSNQDKSKLDRLERKLYSRKGDDVLDPGRSALEPETFDNDVEQVKQSWSTDKENHFDLLASKVSSMAGHKSNFVKKFFVAALVIFVLSVGVAGFVFFGGVNLISSENVDIKVVGPTSIGGGQESSFDVAVINGNNTALKSTTLLVEYPQGTRSASDLTKDLQRERFDLGEIASGENRNQTISAVFFGEKESIKKIKFSLEYRVENSSATFYKEKDYEVSISSAPIILSPTYPKEVNSNQELTFNVEVASNSQDTIRDLVVRVEYPFGFVFRSASPSPFAGENVWKFASLAKGEKRTIAIRGTIIGQDNEEKVFRVSAGTASTDDDRSIGVAIAELTESVLIKKPFIGLGLSLNGRNGDYSAQGGTGVDANLNVMNNLPTRLFNTQVEVSFSGGAFDGLSVSPSQGGFFRSSDNTIFWDGRSVGNLSDLGPGSQTNLSFRLTPRSYSSVPRNQRPEILITVKARGERVLESGSVEVVSATETRKIVLATDLSLATKTFRSQGNFENSGPVPPKANTATTYTVVWSISNSFNQVSNAEVRATLPPYVRWTGLKSPDSDNFTFNPTTNELIWGVGTILPNTGFTAPAREVYFQVELIPSTSQIGQSPVLVGEATLIGTDRSTNAQIGASGASATTNFSGDPIFRMGDEKVVQ